MIYSVAILKIKHCNPTYVFSRTSIGLHFLNISLLCFIM